MHEKLTNKERYRLLCENHKTIPLFMQYWWMDAVCVNKKWDVVIYEKSTKIIAVWVFHYIVKFGKTLIVQPQLTQSSGIWIDFPENLSINKKISFENEAISSLISLLEKKGFSCLEQNFHFSFTNWLPFYWNGYSQTTRYTYQIEDIANIEKCYNEFSYSKKKHIKKASQTIKISLELSGSDFYDDLKSNLLIHNKRVSYSKELFLALYNACLERNKGCIIAAYDNDRNLHGALLIVWDENISYSLVSSFNYNYRTSGASALLFYEAIKMMSSKSKIFDFEGSMNKNIERSFRDFGSIQKPYFQIRKSNSIIMSILFLLKKNSNSTINCLPLFNYKKNT